MATDIRVCPEISRGGRWERIADVPVVDTINNFRDYEVFSVLASVRNHRFASADFRTGGGYEPISEPRGFPADMSQETRHFFYLEAPEGFDIQFHTPTWLRLDEILDYDWNKVTWHSGLIPESEWSSYLELGQPNEWLRDVSGHDVVKLTSEQMQALKNGTFPRDPDKRYYCEVKWATTYWEDCGWFVNLVRDLFRSYGEPSHIRLVMAFDS